MDDIYRQHSQTVYRYLLSLTHDPDLSEELTQETFYQAIKGIDRFDKSCKVSTWLCAISKNLLMSYRRKNRLTQPLEDSAMVADDTESTVLASLNKVELLRLLHGCEQNTREVMYLRLFGDLSFREIGDIVGKSENWARVTYYRGKEKIKREMENDE